MSTVAVEQELKLARAALERQQGDEAEKIYRRVLERAPETSEALNFLGTRAIRFGRSAEAIGWLERAWRADAKDPNVAFNLGLAQLMAEQVVPARDAFRAALDLLPEFFLARLHYARTLELSGQERDAVTQYFAAIQRAQRQGRWLNDATTPPLLRDIVKYGMGYAQAQRKRLFEGVLDGIAAKHGREALTRAYKCLAMFLGERPTVYADPRQIPKFLYYPDLPATPYFARDLFPWYAMLEDNFEVIRAEMAAVLESGEGIEPFLKFHSAEEVSGYLGGSPKARWDAYFFYRHGERYDANCARCPRTAEILDALPTLQHIREHAPEVCFSALPPGSHILPHRGVVNSRLVTHFPLLVPHGDLALRVGGEDHVWQAGRCITFDDTYEHEAWNRTDQLRVVMLLDVWNPYLSAPEREAVTALVETIGDFNRAAEVVSAHNH